jgi:gliding motility-associated-like protein
MYIRIILVVFLTFLCLSNNFAQAPGCPSVSITAPGSMGGQVPINCNECIDLTATALHTGLTDTYTVSSIPYEPPYPYNAGNPIFVAQDDIWSDIINLPFKFCYYGNSYDKIVVGANGIVSFHIEYANQTCPYIIPSNNPSNSLPLNSIFGVFHDIAPQQGGAIFQAVLGSYPCRTFVVNYNQVPLFNCYNLLTTHQVVLYENTNVIEVYIQNKPICNNWNSGKAIVGIQNKDGTAGITAPNRNALPTWATSSEAWRFTPSGTPNYTIEWFNGSNSLGNDNTINICTPSTYTAIATYNNCDSTVVVVKDEIIVKSNDISATIIPPSADICQGDSIDITTTVIGTPPFTYNWAPNNNINSSSSPNITVYPSSSTVYSLTITDGLGCSEIFSIPINVHSSPNIAITASINPICNGEISTLTATGANSYIWSTGEENSNININPNNTTTYTVTGTDQYGCTSSSDINILVGSNPILSINASKAEICEGDSSIITVFGGTNYLWSTNETTDSIIVKPTTSSTYSVTATTAETCFSVANMPILVHDKPKVDFTASPNKACVPISSNFTSYVSDGHNNEYLWTFGENGIFGTSNFESSFVTFDEAGEHNVSLTVTSEYGCSTTLTKPQYISAYPLPIANFYANPDTAELSDAIISFVNQSQGASDWYWNFGDGTKSNDENPFHKYRAGGTFIVEQIAYSQHGCTDTTKKHVYIIYNLNFYVPQAFSPNGDGINDSFGPIGSGIDKLEFSIFDKWGNKVFYTEDINQDWDGSINGRTPNQTSIFNWIAYVTFATGIIKEYTGFVVLYK